MPSTYTLLTWNVRYFGHGLRGLAATRGGITRAARALASLVPLPDLVALQEVESRSLRAGLGEAPQLSRFLDALHTELERLGRPERFTGLHFPAHAYQLAGAPALYTTGLAMLVGPRLVVEADNAGAPHEITSVPKSLFSGFKQRRIVAHVRVRPREGERGLDVFNTHLSLPAFFEVGPHRVAARMGHGTNQRTEIAALLDVVRAQAAGPAVIVGDFNSAPGTPAWRALVEGGFVDAFQAAHGEGAAHATAGFARSRMHIDHVFSTPDLEWEEVQGFSFGQRHGFHGISDHTPKVGRLVLP